MELLKEKLEDIYLQAKDQEVLPEEVKKKKSVISFVFFSATPRGLDLIPKSSSEPTDVCKQGRVSEID